MTQISILNNLTPGTKINSIPVNENFTTIKTAHNETDNRVDNIEADYIKKDGTVDFTGIQSYSSDLEITDPLQLVHRAYIDDVNTPYMAATANMPTIANNVSDSNNDIDFTAGFCWDLTTNAKIVSTAKTKRLDAIFAEGTNQGMLDTGTKTVSTTYHLFVISKSDGTSDYLASTSATSPVMPSGYINKRRIASIRTDASGHIIPIIQFGDIFEYVTPILDVSEIISINTAFTRNITVPTGIKVKAILNINIAISTQVCVYYSSLDTADLAAGGNVAGHTFTGGANSWAGGQIQIKTDTNGAIRCRAQIANYATHYITTLGYTDLRGKN